MGHTALRAPARRMAADIDVHERPVCAVPLIETQPTLERLIPALLRETLDHSTEHPRIVERSFSVCIEIIHDAVAIIVYIDIGRVAVHVPAVTSLVADRA